MKQSNSENDVIILRKALEALSIIKLPQEVQTCTTYEDLTNVIHEASVKFENERTDRYIKRAKITTPHYISSLYNIPERKLDMEYIQELDSLQFVREHRNLIIWGAPGTGKSWIGKMFATSACCNGMRTKWISFPDLYEQLYRLNSDSTGQTLISKLAYYSRFNLLCIDEFPNVSNMDEMLVQQIFNTLSESDTSLLICTQCQPEKIDALFSVQGIGQSIRGRILQRAKRLHLVGPDLRMRPEADN